MTKPTRVDPHALLRWQTLQRLAPAPWLHQEVAQRMAERLSWIKREPQHIIDWWSHHGGGLEALQRQYPRAHIATMEPGQSEPTAVSTSTSAPSWWSRMRGKTTAVTTPANPPAQAELLWSNMGLHGVEDGPALMQRWLDALAVDGFLMFSCFGPDTLRELRALYATQGWGEAHSPFIDMHDLGDALVHAGFADPVMDMEVISLSWPSAQALLTELRGLGRNTAPLRFNGLRTPRWQARLEAELEKQLGPKPKLSFEIIYGHAFKPEPRVKVQSETTITLDTFRGMTRNTTRKNSP